MLTHISSVRWRTSVGTRTVESTGRMSICVLRLSPTAIPKKSYPVPMADIVTLALH
jgi:hypothetical protein